MKVLYDIKDKLMDELEEIGGKPEMKAGDLDMVHKLTDTIKNIDKICMLEEEGYSQAGDWQAEMRGNYGRGNSYGGNGGGNSYNSGNSQRGRRRDSMGRYSRTGHSYNGYSQGGLMEHLEQMMDEAKNDREREAIRRCMDSLR